MRVSTTCRLVLGSMLVLCLGYLVRTIVLLMDLCMLSVLSLLGEVSWQRLRRRTLNVGAEQGLIRAQAGSCMCVFGSRCRTRLWISAAPLVLRLLRRRIMLLGVRSVVSVVFRVRAVVLLGSLTAILLSMGLVWFGVWLLGCLLVGFVCCVLWFDYWLVYVLVCLVLLY